MRRRLVQDLLYLPPIATSEERPKDRLFGFLKSCVKLPRSTSPSPSSVLPAKSSRVPVLYDAVMVKGGNSGIVGASPALPVTLPYGAKLPRKPEKLDHSWVSTAIPNSA